MNPTLSKNWQVTRLEKSVCSGQGYKFVNARWMVWSWFVLIGLAGLNCTGGVISVPEGLGPQNVEEQIPCESVSQCAQLSLPLDCSDGFFNCLEGQCRPVYRNSMSAGGHVGSSLAMG